MKKAAVWYIITVLSADGEANDEIQKNLCGGMIEKKNENVRFKVETASEQEMREYNSKSSSLINGKLNINTADAEELEQLDKIGPKTAQKIIDYRNANGAFKSVDEIKNIKGIGDKTLEKIRDKICAE